MEWINVDEELTPSYHGELCRHNGENPDCEITCDECDYYLTCFPDWETNPTTKKECAGYGTLSSFGQKHNRFDGIPFIPQEFRNFLTIFKHGEV